MTTSNKLDPTTSSILLAKRLAFPPSLNSPVSLNNPEQSKANYTARPTNENRAHGKEAPYWEPRRFVRTVMAKEPSGVSSSFRAKTLVVYPVPPSCYPNDRLCCY